MLRGMSQVVALRNSLRGAGKVRVEGHAEITRRASDRRF